LTLLVLALVAAAGEPIANVPLRIGYGFNLDRVEGEPRGRFFLSLAFRF